jgi:UDP-glucuronate 4-epimerase
VAWNSDRPEPNSSNAPFRVFNIGNSNPVRLIQYIEAIEHALGQKAQLEMLPLQPGDVPDTFADVTELERAVGYRPATTVSQGVAKFVAWYLSYFGSEGDRAS